MEGGKIGSIFSDFRGHDDAPHPDRLCPIPPHREKRGGSLERVPLSDDLPWLRNSSEEILGLDRALDALEQSDPRKVRVLELRVLLGCTAQETAEILGISKATADRDWTLAKAWLYRELAPKE